MVNWDYVEPQPPRVAQLGCATHGTTDEAERRLDVGAAERHRGMVNTILGLAVSSEATRNTAEALDHLHLARVLLDAWERRLRANQGATAPPTQTAGLELPAPPPATGGLTWDEAYELAVKVFPDR